jgi:hypothetical protein
MLRAKYVGLYKVLGISALEDSTDVELAIVRPGLTFRLSADPEPYAAVIDHETAVANIWLKTVFYGGELQGNLEERIHASLESERTARQKRGGTGVFLIVLATDDTLHPNLEHLQDYGSFQTAREAIPAGHFSRLVQKDLERVLASIALVLPWNVTRAIEKVAETAFLEDEDTGKPTYSIPLSFQGGHAYVSESFTLEHRERVAAMFAALSSERDLDTPTRLLAQSLRTREDDPRAFLSAWAALEIFINKTFARYNARWEEALRSGVPASGQRYFDSVKRIMEGKFNLVDKFAVIASMLDPDSGAEDVARLLEAKKARDGFYHAVGEEPSRQLSLELLSKYLHLHLNARKSG